MNEPRHSALLYVSAAAYLGAIAATFFGLLTDPEEWSAGWRRDASFLLDCRMGWSFVAKIVPLAFVLFGFACVVLEEGTAARRMRWAALPIAVAVVVVEVVTWPAPECLPS
jgi:hypothetical protein